MPLADLRLEAWLLDWTKREALGHNDHLVSSWDETARPLRAEQTSWSSQGN